MEPYATPDELASALRIKVTPDNGAQLASCIAAASEEIDHYCDRVSTAPLPDPAPELVHQVCLARAVEWWKSTDAAFGALGFDNTGVLTAPTDTFARHGRSLIPYKAQFGVG